MLYVMAYRLLVITSAVIAYLSTPVKAETSQSTEATQQSSLVMIFGSWSDFWLLRLMLNLLGYATVVVPAALLIRHLKKIKYNETAGPGFLPNLVKLCVFGKDHEKAAVVEETSKAAESNPTERSLWHSFLLLVVCFVGLQTSYLTWGVLQERIMTTEYGKTDLYPGEKFTNSQFLVFMNRILAFVLALFVIILRHQPKHTAPLYKYSYSSFSNIMSSWCQYEALKFVSFPTQVLAKASKIIPVMLMGKVISKKSYEYYEYLTAAMISMGVSLFLLTSGDVTKKNDNVTTLSGVMLLLGYMIFDSFTSNWQGELFKSYKMSSIQMMAGVNLFSCLFTMTSLLEQGGFFESVVFMGRHPSIVLEICILSVCSATGQLFIFYTISQFGPVTFTIMMTVRQGLAIFLSCIIYHHPMTVAGFVGVLIVFAAMFLRIYAGQKKRRINAALKAAAAADNVSKV
ncbi:adenosine 3'-phospho 5'-phosphosulfate transporter 1-like [Liolophura sinensis]|uniref:adenosine 3'-phospho 5'-phosphosulfate transporter 1-like n=1 Tax=Liolophura sinensis TaxID=3198878 RepID=UPI00315866E4